MVTVLVPSWKKKALSEMGWIIVGSVLLTGMIMTIFVCAFMLVTPKQPLYDSRTLVIQHMMQKLEAPLSTVSVAADALRNAKVKLDPRQVNYYQQIITEESRRMNEQVEKFLRDIKNS
jgi:two-component system phosphate regulon sensor histidine kinase PhoR